MKIFFKSPEQQKIQKICTYVETAYHAPNKGRETNMKDFWG